MKTKIFCLFLLLLYPLSAIAEFPRYALNEVMNTKQHLRYLPQKKDFSAEDIMMAGFVLYLVKEPRVQSHFSSEDQALAVKLKNRSSTAKKLLTPEEQASADHFTQMIIGKWNSESEDIKKLADENLDNQLQNLWKTMCKAMSEGNTSALVECFHSSLQSTYQKNFEGLTLNELKRSVEVMNNPIHYVNNDDGTIEYVIYFEHAGEMYLQQINFEQESDGIWKIGQAMSMQSANPRKDQPIPTIAVPSNGVYKVEVGTRLSPATRK